MNAKTSIRKVLLKSLVILSITPILLLSGILSWQSFNVQQMQAKDIQEKQSILASGQISTYIHEQEAILKSAAINFDLINMDRGQRHLLLAKILSSASNKYHKDIFSDLTLLDGKGKEIARVSRTLFLTDADLAERSQADEFLIPAQSGEVYYSPVYFNEQTGEPYLKISIPVTDLQTTRVRGMLIAEIKMNYIWDIIANIRVGDSGIAYMLDKNGRVIAHPNPSVVLRGTYFKPPEQPGITTGLTGAKVVLADEKILFEEQLFHIVTELPVAEAMKYTYRSLLTAVVFLVLTLSCAIALGFVLDRKIVQPIESLAGTAQAISAGDLSVRAEEHHTAELGTLAAAFNTMAAQLITKIDDLNNEINQRKQVEESLRESETKYRIIVDYSYDWEYWLLDDRSFKHMSPSCKEITGYTVKEFYSDPGLLFRIVHPEDLSIFTDHVHQLSTTGAIEPIEFRIVTKTSEVRWISHVCGQVFDNEGKPYGRRGSNRDITWRRLTEEKLKASLQEKELLLREIHHRVKNNMQIISSIFQLQSEYIKDKQSLATLRESKNRVDVMAIIHEKLYQSKSLAKINFQEYIDELITNLLISYGVNTNMIRSEIDAEGILFDINTAIPCGLILNELISNCLKHAFPEGRSGLIKITLHPEGEDIFTLTVSDDGIGIPEKLDFRNTETLGLQLVTALTGQLSGTIELERNKGTSFRITFSELKYSKRL